MERTLRGLHAAHCHVGKDGEPKVVVHRDVSPANVLLSAKGEVKLADFGLARPLNRARRTAPGIVKGKFSYLSPEQAFDRQVDPRSDVFAAGIVLWEALAARSLFRRATDLKTVLAVREAKWRDILPYAPKCDPRLVAALRRALQPDPARRWQSAREFADALAEVQADVPEWSHPIKIAEAIGAVVADVRAAKGIGPREPTPRKAPTTSISLERIDLAWDEDDDGQGKPAGKITRPHVVPPPQPVVRRPKRDPKATPLEFPGAGKPPPKK
jgi:serine/threonine-protein kinase